jgi:hypothetical protein
VATAGLIALIFTVHRPIPRKRAAIVAVVKDAYASSRSFRWRRVDVQAVQGKPELLQMPGDDPFVANVGLRSSLCS